MNLSKSMWGLRAIVYSIFTDVQMPSYIGKPIYIRCLKKIKLGKRVRIYPGIRAEVENDGSIVIGNNTSIGQGFHVVAYGSQLVIGKDVTISGNVFITNCDHTYQIINKSILEQPIIGKTTIIGDNCFIGYGVAILAGTVLGKQCIVGANSVVCGEFSDYCIIAGNPARIIRKYNPENESWEKVDSKK